MQLFAFVLLHSVYHIIEGTNRLIVLMRHKTPNKQGVYPFSSEATVTPSAAAACGSELNRDAAGGS